MYTGKYLAATRVIYPPDILQGRDAYEHLPGLLRDQGYRTVQNLDIAPTVLDYLGLDQPDWMPGMSIITGELQSRPIFGINEATRETGADGFVAVDWDEVEPPFYQFDAITLIYCGRWYKLDLKSLDWETGLIEGSTRICPPGYEISDKQAFEWVVVHLAENGFDVSTLEQSQFHFE